MCSHCTKAAAVLERGAGMPPAGDHARLIIAQCERRETMQRIRKQAGRSAPSPSPDDAIPGVGWVVGLILLAAAVCCAAVVMS